MGQPDWGKVIPNGYLSASSVGTYLQCPRRYEFRYVAGLKMPPALALVEGVSYHDVLASNNRLLMLGKDIHGVDDMVDEFVSIFEDKQAEIEEWDGENKDKVVNRSKAVLSRHHDSVHSKEGRMRKVEAVEAKLERKIGGVPVVGFVDLHAKVGDDKSVAVWDYKFSNRKLSPGDLVHHLQLNIYAIDAGKNSVGIIRNERKVKGNHQIVRNRVTAASKKFTEHTVQNVAKGIAAGCFPLTDPGNWWCSEKWCGYWSKCRGCKRFRSKVLE